MAKLYLLHFEQPYKHAAHYLGFTKHNDVDERVDAHANGSGAKLTRVIKEAGIGFIVARIWNDGTRSKERSMKNSGHLTRACPICRFIKKNAHLF
jgi:predicted GIY-YIG superfamily endonuclease